MELKRILIVEDDADIAAIERDYLELGGYAVTIAPDGTTGLDAALHQPFDLILLDVMLPGIDGFAICKQVRAEKDIPILMVTARGEDVDKIRGLGFGADDYIVKPFSPREVMLRVAAILKRTKPSESESSTIEYPMLKIFPDARKVLVDEVAINLTPKEFELLLYLSKSPEKIFTREVLLKEVWKYEFFGDLRTVDTHVKRLREKLLKQSKPVSKMIVTVWGMGYKFSPNDDHAANDAQ